VIVATKRSQTENRDLTALELAIAEVFLGLVTVKGGLGMFKSAANATARRTSTSKAAHAAASSSRSEFGLYFQNMQVKQYFTRYEVFVQNYITTNF